MSLCRERGQRLVSITVPVYNVAGYLPQCIESICAQTYKALEIILVDDGATDESGSICDKYAGEDARITVIHKANGGLVSARKAGLHASHGEFVSCVDGDDWVEPDMIQKLMEIEAAVGADVIAFAGYEESDGCQGVKGNTAAEGLYQTQEQMKGLYAQMLMDGNFFTQGISPYIWSKLFRRSLLAPCQMRVPDAVSYGEDAACVYPSLLAAGSVYVTNQPLYHYRVRQGSLVRSRQVSEENIRYLYQTLRDSFDAHIQKGALNAQLRYHMWHTCLLKRYDRIRSDLVLFPFPRVKTGMRVAVYGAGLFGQVIEQHCRQTGAVTVAGWFDKRHEEYARQGLAVRSGEDVEAADFDVMVIAILNTALAQKIRAHHIERGIGADRIDVVDRKILDGYELPIGG